MSDRDPDSIIALQIGARAIHVVAPDADARQALRTVLAGFPRARGAAAPDAVCAVSRHAHGLWSVSTNGVEIGHQASTLEAALLAVEWQLVTDVLGHQADRFHLHGAALADPTGAMTVLVLGDSGAGKTTLTLALMAAGFTPYADDVVLVDPETLTVEPFPRAFHVDDTTRRLVAPLFGDRPWELPGSPSGYCVPAVWARVPAPVRAIVFPKAHDHAHPLLMGLTVADTAMALLSYTTTLEQAPALALRTAARLTAVSPGFALWGGAPSVNAELVASVVARLPPSVPRAS